MITPINLILVDRNDNILSFKEKYEAHHHPVPLHRAISVVIYDKSRKKILLQRRASRKPTWPGFWSNATCTHPMPDETYKSAAERRLFEEMGIKTGLTEAFRFVYKAKYDETWGEHELDVVFVGEYSGKIATDPSEVAEYKWMKISDLVIDIEENPQVYTPWFRLILKRLH